MDFKERILTTMNHEEPDRVPVAGFLGPITSSQILGKQPADFAAMMGNPELRSAVKDIMNSSWPELINSSLADYIVAVNADAGTVPLGRRSPISSGETFRSRPLVRRVPMFGTITNTVRSARAAPTAGTPAQRSAFRLVGRRLLRRRRISWRAFFRRMSRASGRCKSCPSKPRRIPGLCDRISSAASKTVRHSGQERTWARSFRPSPSGAVFSKKRMISFFEGHFLSFMVSPPGPSCPGRSGPRFPGGSGFSPSGRRYPGRTDAGPWVFPNSGTC